MTRIRMQKIDEQAQDCKDEENTQHFDTMKSSNRISVSALRILNCHHFNLYYTKSDVLIIALLVPPFDLWYFVAGG